MKYIHKYIFATIIALLFTSTVQLAGDGFRFEVPQNNTQANRCLASAKTTLYYVEIALRKTIVAERLTWLWVSMDKATDMSRYCVGPEKKLVDEVTQEILSHIKEIKNMPRDKRIPAKF